MSPAPGPEPRGPNQEDYGALIPTAARPTLAIHKFSSCDGCQLALLNLGEGLLDLARMVDIRHFVEAGPMDEDASVDIALVEGCISTAEEAERIRRVRANSRYLIAIGACATSGGVQALRNLHDAGAWTADIYAHPQYIDVLANATSLADRVRVDCELYGCPVNGHQVLAAVRSLLSGVTPLNDRDKLCAECKRRHNVCVMVARGLPCMGPVTATGCGVLCPTLGRDCYGCYGPAENVNSAALGRQLEAEGMSKEARAGRFLFIHSNAPEFASGGSSGED